MFICAFLVLTLSPPTPRSAPPPPTSEVTVSERLIQLPYLPETIARAHTESSTLRTRLAEGLKDLEGTLKGLYASPEAKIPLPTSYKLPHSKTEELHFLLSIVSGERYWELEDPFFRTWEAWQAVLVENGLAKPAQAAATPAQPCPAETRESKELGMRLKGLQKSDSALKEEESVLISMFTARGHGTDWNAITEIQGVRAKNHDRIITTQTIAATANRHAPSLAKTWAPLADCLNADALHLANLEVSAKSLTKDEMQPLRVQARIQFLERFRSALWLSSMVWARMTSNTPPTTLQDLDPRQELGSNPVAGK